MPPFYAGTPERVAKVTAAIEAAFARGDTVGLDTEFYGLDIRKESTVARSKMHLMSVAVKRFPHVLHPKGYHVSDAAVLDASALSFPPFRALLSGRGSWAVHNLPVDAHTLHNAGIELEGAVNTLALARWAWPERARGAGFTLDSLGLDLVGAGKTIDFRELFSEVRTEYTVTSRKVKACECGTKGCRMRSTTPGHARIEGRVETRRPRLVTYPVPLESVVPGHPLWEKALDYAAQDAVLALAVYDLAIAASKRRKVNVPW
jgi:hypothetical protein